MIIGITWGVQGGRQVPLQYFFYLRIVFLTTEVKKGKYKNSNIFKIVGCKDRKELKTCVLRDAE
jgi:hypothetical protein